MQSDWQLSVYTMSQEFGWEHLVSNHQHSKEWGDERKRALVEFINEHETECTPSTASS